jgi:DNA-binding NarL/FixJ family response regulator
MIRPPDGFLHHVIWPFLKISSTIFVRIAPFREFYLVRMRLRAYFAARDSSRFEPDAIEEKMRKTLTRRELDVVRAIVDHGTIDRAASALALSRHTVDRHVDNVRKKCGLHYLPQITAFAATQGWLAHSASP